MNLTRSAQAISSGLLILGGLLLTAGAPLLRGAAVDDADANPYSVIMEKNIFHLNPPPPPPKPDEPKLELPTVCLTGFVNYGGNHKVLFVATPKDKKESLYYTLSEGERSGDGKLELVKIHPSFEAVDVLNDGTPQTLTIKDNSLPITGAPAAAATTTPVTSAPMHPGERRMPGRPMFQPGNVNGGNQNFPGLPNGFNFPARARRNLGPPMPGQTQ